MDNISTSEELVSKVNSCSKKYIEYMPQQSDLLVEAYKQEITDLFTIAEKASITLNNDELYDDCGIFSYRGKLENNHIDSIKEKNTALIETTKDKTKAFIVYKEAERKYVKDLRNALFIILKKQFPHLIAPESPNVVATDSSPQPRHTRPKTIIALHKKVTTPKKQVSTTPKKQVSTTPKKQVSTTPKKQLPVVEKPLIAVQEPETLPEPIIALKVQKVMPEELRQELHNIVVIPTNRSTITISDDIHTVRKSYNSLMKKYHTYLKYVDNIPQGIIQNIDSIDKKLASYESQKATFFKQYEQQTTPLYNKLVKIDTFLKEYFPM